MSETYTPPKKLNGKSYQKTQRSIKKLKTELDLIKFKEKKTQVELLENWTTLYTGKYVDDQNLLSENKELCPTIPVGIVGKRNVKKWIFKNLC